MKVTFIIAKLLVNSLRILKTPFWLLYNLGLMKINKIKFKSFPNINGFIYIVNRGNINIGEKVVINSGRYSNPVGNCNQTILYCYPNSEIVIGDNVSISNVLIFCQCKIKLEDYVMIGGGTQIWDTDFHPINLSDRIKHDVSKIETKPVLLKRGCFVGANSIILKGCTIGENSIIGAGSVVTKDVPDYEIWGGNPARFIKKL